MAGRLGGRDAESEGTVNHVKSLLVTGDREELGFVALAIGLMANCASQKNDTQHWRIMPEDWDKCVAACRKLNVTTQTIEDVPCEIYPLLHQGVAKPVPPVSRWCFHWMKIIPGVPLFAWLNDDRSMTYKGPPFDGRVYNFDHSAEHHWLQIGDLAQFADVGIIYWLGPNGTWKQFKDETEAKAYAEQHNQHANP